MMTEQQLLRAFRFKVTLKRAAVRGPSPAPPDRPEGFELADGAFQECSGLEIEMDVQEYQEGGRNNATVRRVGRARYSPIILKRGMFYSGDSGPANKALWKWLQDVVSGVRPVERYDGTIEVMSKADDVSATWTFDRGLPMKIRGPELNAKTGEVAIEELHIAHEGLRLA
jgi:phage tail-like protein